MLKHAGKWAQAADEVGGDNLSGAGEEGLGGLGGLERSLRLWEWLGWGLYSQSEEKKPTISLSLVIPRIPVF